jgi:hypothetical protein
MHIALSKLMHNLLHLFIYMYITLYDALKTHTQLLMYTNRLPHMHTYMHNLHKWGQKQVQHIEVRELTEVIERLLQCLTEQIINVKEVILSIF